jgi:hypothetical protein
MAWMNTCQHESAHMSTNEGARAGMSIRIKPQLKALIETMAKEDGRTMSSLIERLLTEAVEARMAKKPRK